MTYDWQKMGRTEFLHWILPVVLGDLLQREGVERLSQATTNFTEVTMTMQINGIEVDAEAFIDATQRHMRACVETEAARLVEEAPEREKLQTANEAVSQVLADAHDSIKRLYEAAGVVFPRDDW